jgi:hypothetical protein
VFSSVDWPASELVCDDVPMPLMWPLRPFTEPDEDGMEVMMEQAGLRRIRVNGHNGKFKILLQSEQSQVTLSHYFFPKLHPHRRSEFIATTSPYVPSQESIQTNPDTRLFDMPCSTAIAPRIGSYSGGGA